MSLVVTCVCGKRLQIPREAAGKRVKCPNCQTVLPIPASAGTMIAAATPQPAPAATKPDMLRFNCPECDKPMQSRAAYAGRTTRCPGCQATFAIPGGAAQEPRTPIPSEPPAPRRSRPDEDQIEEVTEECQPKQTQPPHEDEEEIEEVTTEYQPKKKRRKWAFAASPMLVYIGLGVGALLLVVVGVIGAVYMFGGKGGGADLALVPTEADGLLSVRLGEVWKTDVVQNALKKLPPAALEELKEEQESGLTLGDIERVTVVSQGAAAQMPFPSQLKSWGVLRFSRPYDQKKTLEKAKGKIEDRTYQDTAYKVVTQPGQSLPMGLYFVDDRLLVVGTEAGVKAAIDVKKGPKAAGSLSPAIALIQSGKHHLVAAGAIPPQALALARPMLANLPPNYQVFLELKSVLVKGQLSKNLDLEFALTFPDAAKASKAKEELLGLRGTAQIGLAGLKNQPGPPQQQQALTQAEKALADLVLDTRGADAILKTSLDLDALSALVPRGSPVAGPGGVVGPAGPVEEGGLFQAPKKLQNSNNLKQLALALHNYHDVHGRFPPSVIYSQDGRRPLYSWRVALLPFVEEGALHQQFKLDQPWNSLHNRRLHSRMPKVFQHPLHSSQSLTYYQVFTGVGSPFEDKRGPAMTEITDGASNTIAIAEAAQGVQWTQPVDLAFTNDVQAMPVLLSQVGGHFGNTFNVALFDGSVRSLPKTISPATLKAAITPNGGERMGPDW